ncbi:hypothetical protein PR202_gb13390 [Eleusine coracana subsp. coracana]|uniref:DUF7032 domain-containing protein n=1 Tax=Eleusine coracana subsp. coracana TaxID=191504 RepID=A0AAV5ES01_ELECO|nr:hypothetical protein QOZ80_9BG0714420 [Eleusine coracana subsp. coracana]GJN25548.1 hypothetical protein PR202_gb13390 [Eleusine coracana subsp. coracana]
MGTESNPGTAGEEMVGMVGGMAAAALDAVRATGGFPQWWKAIAANLEKLRTCLLDLSSHPCQIETYNKALCRVVLQSVADTLTEATVLAGRCREYSWFKLEGSAIDAVAVKVEVSLRDCELLVKIGELYLYDQGPLDDTSSTCVQQLQRLLAWLQMSHTEAKSRALDGLLEALRKDEKRVVSMFDRDSVSTVVQLLNAPWPEVIRDKAATVVGHVAGTHAHVWLLESEAGLPLLVRMAESGNVTDRHKAVVALHQLSSTSRSTARAIVSHLGVGPLIEMCRRNHMDGGGDSVSQTAAAGTLKNIFRAMDFRRSVDSHRSVRVMVYLLDHADAVPETKEHAAECLEDFTSRHNDDGLRRYVVSEGGLRALLLYHLGDKQQDRHETAAVKAIHNLVGVISTTTMKRVAGEQGGVPLLVRAMLESNSVREVAVDMLACLATYPPNAMEMSEDGKCVAGLVRLLHAGPKTNIANKYSIQCLLLLESTNKRCRNLMISHGAKGHLTRLSDLKVQGATELLHRLEGGWLSSLFGSSKQ